MRLTLRSRLSQTELQAYYQLVNDVLAVMMCSLPVLFEKYQNRFIGQRLNIRSRCINIWIKTQKEDPFKHYIVAKHAIRFWTLDKSDKFVGRN